MYLVCRRAISFAYSLNVLGDLPMKLVNVYSSGDRSLTVVTDVSDEVTHYTSYPYLEKSIEFLITNNRTYRCLPFGIQSKMLTSMTALNMI